ncbi:tyrosine--tRNA ligase 1, cytoplasmic-like protein, partial [Tanacetum coccineum]
PNKDPPTIKNSQSAAHSANPTFCVPSSLLSTAMATPPEKEVESLSLTSSSTSTPQMSDEEKYNIVRSIGEECIQEEELRNLLAKKPNPICYDGFEPSGRMHIAQLLQ